MTALKRDDYVLAMMGLTGGRPLEPVHVQKLFFLLDNRVAPHLGKAYFDFKAYDYGPFDKTVYEALGSLSDRGDVAISRSTSGLRQYSLTPKGVGNATKLAAKLPDDVRSKAQRLGEWVVAQDFATLVSAIYKAYPAMKENSVFVQR
jgi:hypothetical protein